MNDPTSGGRPEILAPAGTPAKLRTALHFGADAVYVGLRQFSMRSGAGNFGFDELEWALGYAHDRGARVYVALNIQPFDGDLPGIEASLRRLAALAPDALIVADPGVVALAAACAPAVPLHLSTQTSVTNAATARFWFGHGVERIVVARELSLEQLGALVASAGGPIEAFAHGAVCIAYSGRCLLSLYWAGRDPRHGSCAGACRWEYRAIEDSRRPGLASPVEEDERGTAFFDAKDLCTIPILDRLLATGVRSLKIEGRTRSPYYVAQVTDVYRHAADRLTAGDAQGFEAAKDGYVRELLRACCRPFSTHFLTGDQDSPASYLPGGCPKDGSYEYVGEVEENRGDAVVVAVRNPVSPGATVELRDRGLSTEPVVLTEVRLADGSLVDKARTGDRLLLPGHFRAGPLAIARLTAPVGGRRASPPATPGAGR